MLDIKSILVPIDFSNRSRAAMLVASELAQSFDAHLTLCHVHFLVEVAMLDYVYQESAERAAEAVGRAEEQLRAWSKELPLADDRRSVQVLVGHPLDQLIDASSKHDLIVMATHGRSGLSHFLMGSVAERLVQASRCSVYVVKGIEDGE